jgi:hypothetical protein
VDVIDYVWVSGALQDSTLTLRLETDITSENLDKAIVGQRMNKEGRSVPPEFCPKKIWGDGTGPAFQKMPDLFWAMSQWVVSEKAAQVLKQHDLGGGSLYPVSEGVFQSDRVTRVSGNYFCWIFGNVKSALLPDASENMRAPDVPGLWWGLPSRIHDGDVAVSRKALADPAVWLDKMLFKAVFLSRPLGDALDDAGLRKAFRLFKCRVI